MELKQKNPYRLCLDLFLGDDENSPALSSPFIQQDFAIATDAYTIILFEKSKLDEIDFVSHEKAPNALAVIPGENMKAVFETSYLIDAIKKSRENVKEQYKAEKDTCRDCFGCGVVDFHFDDKNDERHEIEHTCPVCDGTGTIEFFKNIKTGDFLHNDFKEIIGYKNSFIQTDFIERLVKVAQLLNEPQIYLVFRTGAQPIHKFIIGDVTVCLMPVSELRSQDIVTNIELLEIA